MLYHILVTHYQLCPPVPVFLVTQTETAPIGDVSYPVMTGNG